METRLFRKEEITVQAGTGAQQKESMKNPKLDLAIATEICGYPKDGWGAMIGLSGDCILYKKISPAAPPCTMHVVPFSPSSNWKLAGPLLEAHGVDLEMLLFNNLPGMVT